MKQYQNKMANVEQNLLEQFKKCKGYKIMKPLRAAKGH